MVGMVSPIMHTQAVFVSCVGSWNHSPSNHMAVYADYMALSTRCPT